MHGYVGTLPTINPATIVAELIIKVKGNPAGEDFETAFAKTGAA